MSNLIKIVRNEKRIKELEVLIKHKTFEILITPKEDFNYLIKLSKLQELQLEYGERKQYIEENYSK